MRNCTAVSLVMVGSGVLAEPSAMDACKHFLPSVTVSEINGGQVAYGLPEFELIATKLDRYQTFATGEFILEKSSPREGSAPLVFGYASASVICVVDSVDRRVLTLAITPGSSAGSKVTDPRDSTRTTQLHAVDPVYVEVGAQVHQGKY